MGSGQGSEPCYRVRPDLAVINLEGVVVPVLSGPELDVVTPELSCDADGLADQVEGPRSYCGVGVGERAPAELAGVDLRGDADSSQAVALEGLGDLLRAIGINPEGYTRGFC